MKPPIIIPTLLVFVCAILISCSKTEINTTRGQASSIDSTLPASAFKDFREKYTGVFKLDVSYFRAHGPTVYDDTLYQDKYYTFSYKITDTAYYPTQGNLWYQLPAIRVSIKDGTGFTDTSKYALWGIRDSVNNEVVYTDTKHTHEKHTSEGGFILNTATSTLDSIYLKYSYGTPKIHTREVFRALE